jgi:hypothetical protein
VKRPGKPPVFTAEEYKSFVVYITRLSEYDFLLKQLYLKMKRVVIKLKAIYLAVIECQVP